MTTMNGAFPVERPDTPRAAVACPAAPLPTLATGALPERMAVLVRDGVHREQVEALLDRLDREGHDVRVLGERLGSVRCSDGTRLPVDASLRRWPAWYFDRVVRCASQPGEPARLTQMEAGFLKPGEDASAVPLQCLPWPQEAPVSSMH